MIRIRTSKKLVEKQYFRNNLVDIHKDLGDFIFKNFPELIMIKENEEYTDYFINIPTRIYLPYMGNFEAPFYVVWFYNAAIPHICEKKEVKDNFCRANDSILYEGNLIDCENYFNSFMQYNKFLNKANLGIKVITGLKIDDGGY